MYKSWIDNIVFGGIVFILLGIPIIRLMIKTFKQRKEDRYNPLSDIADKFMKLFDSLLVRKAYEVIKEVMIKERITMPKYEQALNLPPNHIADVYPTDSKLRQKYLFYLVYVMMKGNSNSFKKRTYIEIVANKLGFTRKDILQTMEAVKVLLLRSPDKSNNTTQWQFKSARHFTKEELDLVDKALVVESQYGYSCCFFMKNGTTLYVPMSKDSKSKAGDYINLNEAEIVTLSKEGEKDIQRIKG